MLGVVIEQTEGSRYVQSICDILYDGTSIDNLWKIKITLSVDC